VSEYETSVATQLCNLKQQHEAQMTDLLLRCETERPSRPQHSAEILNGRKIEEALVKQVSAETATQGGLLAACAVAHLMCRTWRLAKPARYAACPASDHLLI
jgi:hypothetical protein